MNIIVCLLEGPHDAAFLHKILKSNGYLNFKGAIKELPEPIFSFVSNPKHLSNSRIEDMTFDFANRRLYPFDILMDNAKSNCIILYGLLGENNEHLREKIIRSIDDVVIIEDASAADFSNKNTYSVLYILDSDNNGVNSRLEKVSQEVHKFLPDSDAPNFTENGSICNVGDVEFGAYIITNFEGDMGRLEDILIPIMRSENEDIFEKAEYFLSIHEETNLFRGKVEKSGNKITKINNVKFDYNKSLIGTVGQLQKSGMSNTVCIQQTDYLAKNKILADVSCNKLIKFIELAIK